MRNIKSKPIEVPAAFEAAPDRNPQGTPLIFTAEQDYVILKHMRRMGVRGFVKIFQEAYHRGSYDTLRNRYNKIVDLGATCENVMAMHQRGEL